MLDYIFFVMRFPGIVFMAFLAFKLAYDGADYAGWQRQPNTKQTVQEVLEKVLKKFPGIVMPTVASGRTDRGVHAKAQVVSVEINDKFNLPLDKIAVALNAPLPDSIKIFDAKIFDFPFNARFDAIARQYSFLINQEQNVFDARYKWYVTYKLDIDRMNEAAKIFLGEHDFTTFSKINALARHHKSNVELCEWERIDEKQLKFHIKANRFVYSQVRALVSVMVDVGRSKLDNEYVMKALAAKNRDLQSTLAPPNGLYFEKVYYPEKFGL